MNSQTVGYKAKAFEAWNLAFFFLIAFGLPLLAFGPFIFGILRWPARVGAGLAIIFTVARFSPLIAAFVVTAITEGKASARALWSRFWNLNIRIKWLLVALLLNPALRLVASLVDRTLASQAYPFFDTNFLTMVVTGLIIGMQEEFGWRGYVLPRFQAKWNALTSSIILGVIWAPYHLGNWFLPPGQGRQDSFWEFALWIILLSILYTWIFNNTNGSILAAILFHGMVTNGLIQCCGVSWAMELLIGVTLLAVILIVIIFGARSLVRGRPEQVTRLQEVRVAGT